MSGSPELPVMDHVRGREAQQGLYGMNAPAGPETGRRAIAPGIAPEPR